ncbi:carbohydrate-binding protein [Streptomyces sp. NPDC001941]|uniref:carbohydrate-binding protein n=1 Tax=Streptomyces sp. NPDC001941 TaxID=3154659 RepID=UPI00332F81A6
MAAGDNGASTPEDDDPFGYLYEDGQASGARPPRQGGYGYPGPMGQSQPGVPRTSYNQVRTVGERQYGQQQYGQPPYGQQVPHQGQYNQPSPQYAAPETYPGGSVTRPVPVQEPSQRGGPNTRGLLIGAIAVVLVVVAGITVAVLTNGNDKNDDAAGGGVTPSQSQEQSPSPEASDDSGDKPVELPRQDAATLRLGPPAALAKDIKGAKGADGAYVAFNGVGGSASWSVDVPEDGPYTIFITYGVPGKDAKTSLTINDQKPRTINMSNFARAKEGDWEKGWTRTFSFLDLKKGKNDLKISCEQGDQCDAYLDQVFLKQGHVRN